MLKEDSEIVSQFNHFTADHSLQHFDPAQIELQPNTAYLFDQLKSQFFNEMLDDASISIAASKKN